MDGKQSPKKTRTKLRRTEACHEVPNVAHSVPARDVASMSRDNSGSETKTRHRRLCQWPAIDKPVDNSPLAKVLAKRNRNMLREATSTAEYSHFKALNWTYDSEDVSQYEVGVTCSLVGSECSNKKERSGRHATGSNRDKHTRKHLLKTPPNVASINISTSTKPHCEESRQEMSEIELSKRSLVNRLFIKIGTGCEKRGQDCQPLVDFLKEMREMISEDGHSSYGGGSESSERSARCVRNKKKAECKPRVDKH